MNIFAQPTLPNVVDPATGLVRVDLDCRRCGYNLRTLPETGVCPECGSPVGLSTRGNFLQFADPGWVKKVAKGLQIVVVALIAHIVLSLFAGWMQGMSLYLFDVIGAIVCYGIWLITEPDHAGIGDKKNDKTRKILRFLFVAAFVGQFIQTVGILSTGRMDAVVQTVLEGVITTLWLMSLVAWFVLYGYLSAIAQRIPNRAMADRFLFLRKMMLIAVGVAVAGAVISMTLVVARNTVVSVLGLTLILTAGTALIVFGVWTIILIHRLHRSVADEAVAAAQNWANASVILPVAAPIDRDPAQ